MEELIAADSMRREIVADAERKAGRMLAEAEAEAGRELGEGRALAARAAADTARESAERIAARRAEALAREPLERMRLLVAFVDRALGDAVSSYLGRLGDDEAVRLAAAPLARCAIRFAGARAIVRRKGLPRAAADRVAALIGEDAAAEPEENAGLASRGFRVESADGSIRLDATLALVEERLLDERRGELAEALCSEALRLAAEAERASRAPAGGRG